MEFIFTFFLIRYLRGKLTTKEENDRWFKLFNYIILATIILFGLHFIPQLKPVCKWLGHIFLFGSLYIVTQKDDFANFKLLGLALLPITVVSFFNDIVVIANKDFYKSISTILDVAEGFSFIWLIVGFILFRKQYKAQEKERIIRLQEQEENRVNAQRKAQLENMVQERTAEITLQKEKLEKTLQELNLTQQQLIHAEKMASLGELTAGIAHEIQNPLNFINNFSELNAELVDELLEAIKTGDWEETSELAVSLKENALKVAHHGRRADGIVKSMLQHSRGNAGQKEPVNINQLVDECIRLSFHGMRAKEKNFNAKIETNFDENMGVMQGIGAELSRVFLNICTNALYAVFQQSKKAESSYHPTLWVATKEQGDEVHVTFKDNGMGIPKEAIDKIFQPFFTTKPTGEGTGLGLSISYDIITKIHGGQLQVASQEGSGTTFKIILPTNL